MAMLLSPSHHPYFILASPQSCTVSSRHSVPLRTGKGKKGQASTRDFNKEGRGLWVDSRNTACMAQGQSHRQTDSCFKAAVVSAFAAPKRFPFLVLVYISQGISQSTAVGGRGLEPLAPLCIPVKMADRVRP